MFISTYANQTTFILYIFILTLFYVWHGICGGGQIIIILQIFISKKKSMRRVRLTEGQLHNVIRESVCQILNELDWKTLYGASKIKAKRMQNPDDMDEYRREIGTFQEAEYEAQKRKYPHFFDENERGCKISDLSPEAQKEYLEYMKENENYSRYKYEKGGRGYYLDDEE